MNMCKDLSNVRTLTEDRKAQGFRSQAHLDAFFAYYDHSKCECCQKFDHVPLDDGYQPVQVLCPEGERLYKESCKY